LFDSFVERFLELHAFLGHRFFHGFDFTGDGFLHRSDFALTGFGESHLMISEKKMKSKLFHLV
jgi:hypothetical protein